MKSKEFAYGTRIKPQLALLLTALFCFAQSPVHAGSLCGNTQLDFNEECDDGNQDDGDGCSRLCEIENGYQCTDPFLNLEPNFTIEDGGFEFGPNAEWQNLSNIEPIVCNLEECATEPVGARNGQGWAQFGGVAQEPFVIGQQPFFEEDARFLKFEIKHAQCPSAGSNDLFRININGNTVYFSGADDPGCNNGQRYETKLINLDTVDGGPYAGAGDVDLVMELLSFEGTFKLAVDNVQVGKPAGPPVPSICTLDPNISLYQPFEDIGGPLGLPDFEQKVQGEIELLWGTTDDGICGNAQNPPGNHTGEPGEAACIDSTFLGPLATMEPQRLLANTVETYVCNAPVDLSVKLQSQLQLVVNYQPGPLSSQDFFGVWVGDQPFFGTIDLGASMARLLVNDPQGQFGQSPGLAYEIDISDLDGQPEVYVCFGYGNEGGGYAQVDTVILSSDGCIDDFEEDKILGCNDNCLNVENPSQKDSDNDGYGNACDADIARNASGVPAAAADNASGNDCFVNFQDFFQFSQAMFSDPTRENWNPDADFNDDNLVNFLDLARFSELFLNAPGPSGVASTCSAGSM